jgi:hypothetical protein
MGKKELEKLEMMVYRLEVLVNKDMFSWLLRLEKVVDEMNTPTKEDK